MKRTHSKSSEATTMHRRPRAAEFFAGVGLVRMGIESAGFDVVFANDIDRTKRDVYALNFDPSIYLLDDVRHVRACQIPDIDLATASFPCTDLSLAGNRAGLTGKESSLLGEFLRLLDEMGTSRPPVVFIENVPGFASSKNGQDLSDSIKTLNRLGYLCDVLIVDAKRFVPQSRPRLFLIAFTEPGVSGSEFWNSTLRPSWLNRLAKDHPGLRMSPLALPSPPEDCAQTLDDILEEIPPSDERWWTGNRREGFLSTLSEINAKRVEAMRRLPDLRHATAYRRTRNGAAVWEIRADRISGCLRTARGGSSKQALVEAGKGTVRVRWMTAREYARLQGAPDLQWGDASESQAKFALGDAVCVPAVSWLAHNALMPLLPNVG